MTTLMHMMIELLPIMTTMHNPIYNDNTNTYGGDSIIHNDNNSI